MKSTMTVLLTGAILLFVLFGCQREDVPNPLLPPDAGPALRTGAADPHEDQLRILSLGLAGIAGTQDFQDAFNAVLPCDGQMWYDDFGGAYRTASGGRALEDDLNAYIRTYLGDGSNRDYVRPALAVLSGGNRYVTLTMPFVEYVDLTLPVIVAPAIEREDDALEGWLVLGRDTMICYMHNPPTNLIALKNLPHVFGCTTLGVDENAVGIQYVTESDASQRPVLVVGTTDDEPEYINDPCYYLGNGPGGSGGSGQMSGPPEERRGPVNDPSTCVDACTTNCLFGIQFQTSQLNARHNASATYSTVKWVVTQVSPNGTLSRGVTGTLNPSQNIGADNTEQFLEKRHYNDIYNTVSVTDSIYNLICYHDSTPMGYDNSLWTYNRVWLTVYEEDWWAWKNKVETDDALLKSVNTNAFTRIRVTSDTDLYLNLVINPDTYFAGDSYLADDGWPGQFLLLFY